MVVSGTGPSGAKKREGDPIRVARRNDTAQRLLGRVEIAKSFKKWLRYLCHSGKDSRK